MPSLKIWKILNDSTLSYNIQKRFLPLAIVVIDLLIHELPKKCYFEILICLMEHSERLRIVDGPEPIHLKERKHSPFKRMVIFFRIGITAIHISIYGIFYYCFEQEAKKMEIHYGIKRGIYYRSRK